MLPPHPHMHHAHLVQILPELEFAWIGAQFLEIPTQEHFTVANLRGVFERVLIDWAFIGGGARGERASGDVIFKEFFVHDVDNRRDEGSDVL
jgi:hypothetical protein